MQILASTNLGVVFDGFLQQGSVSGINEGRLNAIVR